MTPAELLDHLRNEHGVVPAGVVTAEELHRRLHEEDAEE